jgi:hypothetical protein
MDNYLPDDYASTVEGLAARFNYPNVIPAVRGLGFRADMTPGVDGAPPTYSQVEYEVQLCPDPIGPVEIVWMPIQQWRELVGMTAS